jgi:hypothetical protein
MAAGKGSAWHYVAPRETLALKGLSQARKNAIFVVGWLCVTPPKRLVKGSGPGKIRLGRLIGTEICHFRLWWAQPFPISESSAEAGNPRGAIVPRTDTFRLALGTKLRRLIPACAVAAVIGFSSLAQVPSVASVRDVGYGYGNNCGVKGSGFHDHGKVCPNRPFPGQGINKSSNNGKTHPQTSADTTTAATSGEASSTDTTTVITEPVPSVSDGNSGNGKGKGHGHGKGHGQAKGD